jgi:hypothetical protein
VVKVIFLDFDGVIVVSPNFREPNRGCVARLNEIVRRSGAVVVVSSSWRIIHPLDELRALLLEAGFVGEVIDKTPYVCYESDTPSRLPIAHASRGREIRTWLGEHPEVESYVVLDDDFDYDPLPAGRWVLVKNGIFDGGLQQTHVAKACALLAQPLERRPGELILP